ncbi:DUF3277 family protein [Apilactobacillus sp. TMW 2.2459]|uniref:DUF3277 family protein n=1 Tax=Apilactobacillus xinyiensis TaxID=2841032 RepID=UPI00200E2F14|nr:DUF3277 family protein [Apilactobacillus xinyiensis]MCL0312788.1 DUF3277 family protein [Apilactobacillus xinyiensis]
MAIQSFNGARRIDVGDGDEIDLYDAGKVNITITRGNGQTIILKNFQDGDMVSGSKTNNKVDTMSDAQGSSAGAVTKDKLGSLQTTLQQGSRSNELLSDMYNNDEVFAMWVNYGHERYGCDYCIIQKAPDTPYGKSVPTRQWTIDCFKYDYNGNAQ